MTQPTTPSGKPRGFRQLLKDLEFIARELEHPSNDLASCATTVRRAAGMLVQLGNRYALSERVQTASDGLAAAYEESCRRNDKKGEAPLRLRLLAWAHNEETKHPYDSVTGPNPYLVGLLREAAFALSAILPPDDVS